MKSSNYVICQKKIIDMGKCTSCIILYIIQNPTTYKETTSFAFLLESSTTNQSIPNNIIYSPPPLFFKKNKKKKNGHQQSPRFHLTCTSRACSLKVLPK